MPAERPRDRHSSQRFGGDKFRFFFECRSDRFAPMLFEKFRRSRDLYARMRKTPVFQDLSLLEWRRVECILHEREYGEGELIFSEGDEGLGLYVVMSGRVQMARKAGGVLKELAQLTAGETFGELTLIDGGARTAQAVAMEPTSLVGFFRPDLLDLLRTEPRIASKVYVRLAELVACRLRRLLEDRNVEEVF